MKYHNLYIDTSNDFETYQKITEILKVAPTENSKEDQEKYSTWAYQVVNNEEIDYFDFINVFLEILEPNFEKLSLIGIQKENILIWLLYEFDQQCALGFNAEELKRIGQSGIALNIDCIPNNKE